MNLAKYFSMIRQVPLTLITIAIALAAFWNSSLAAGLEIHLQGAAWNALQLVGCHLLHWSDEHLLWDLGMFAVLAVACERQMPGAFYATYLGSAVSIPLTVFWCSPHIDVYRGLSGIDTAAFSLLVTASLIGSWLDMRRTAKSDRSDGRARRQALVGGMLLLALWCKIGFEFRTGSVLFVHKLEFEPLPMAHAVGALLGSVIAALTVWTNEKRSCREARPFSIDICSTLAVSGGGGGAQSSVRHRPNPAPRPRVLARR